jgi:hypothetical protein
MHAPTLQIPFLPASILLSVLAIVATAATALLLGWRAEHRLQQVRIPVESPRPRKSRRR